MPPTHTTEGLEAAETIREEFPDTAVVALSAHVQVERATALLASGERSGYLLKSRVTDVEDLVDPLVGEFPVRYAGFFDPGFGYEPGRPPSARGVLEVRSREVPFILEHGQIIGRLVFERLTDPPPEVYGQGIG